MATVQEVTENFLDAVPFLNYSVQRGFLDERETAKWLLQAHGLEATVGEVVDIIQEYEVTDPGPVEGAFETLENSKMTSRRNLSRFIFPLKEGHKLVDMSLKVPIDAIAEIAIDDDHVHCLIDYPAIPTLKELFRYPKTKPGFGQITLEFPYEDASVFPVAMQLLRAQGIEATHPVLRAPDHVVLTFSEDQFEAGYEILAKLTSQNDKTPAAARP